MVNYGKLQLECSFSLGGTTRKNEDIHIYIYRIYHDISVKQKVGLLRELPTAKLCTIYISSR